MAYKNRYEFYRSPEWTKFRQVTIMERLDEYGGLRCEHCGRVLLRPYEIILHHVTELDDTNVFDANVALNPENIQIIDPACHNKVHARAAGIDRTKNIRIVWGSPCAGKRKYVEEAAGPRDLIIDIDSLYASLGVAGNRTAVKSNVLATYRSLIDMVRTRNGNWKTAWILRTLPLRIDRESLLKETGGGELIHIDTSYDECMMEARTRGGEWEKWTEQYWVKYQPPED